MKEFDLFTLVWLFHSLQEAQNTCADVSDQQINYSFFIDICERTVEYCNSVGFYHSSRKASELKTAFEIRRRVFTIPTIQEALRGLETDIFVDMMQHKFVQIDKKLSQYFENKNLFDSKVSKAFRNASADIVEAGNCLAVGLDTAAVFHLMRVVEWGLRAFATDLGLLEISVGHKDNKTVPIAWENHRGRSSLLSLTGPPREP